MSISSIENTASSWASLLQQGSTAAAASSTATSSNAATAFSAALDQIKGTPAVTAASSSSSSDKSGGSSSGSDSSGDKKTTTLTRIAPDGSMILIVMQGNTIVSERKIGGASQSEAKNSKTAAIDAKLDQFNAGAGVPAGTLFSAST